MLLLLPAAALRRTSRRSWLRFPLGFQLLNPSPGQLPRWGIPRRRIFLEGLEVSPSCVLGTRGEGSRGAFCLAAAPGAAPARHRQPPGDARGVPRGAGSGGRSFQTFFTAVRSSGATMLPSRATELPPRATTVPLRATYLLWCGAVGAPPASWCQHQAPHATATPGVSALLGPPRMGGGFATQTPCMVLGEHRHGDPGGAKPATCTLSQFWWAQGSPCPRPSVPQPRGSR